MNKYNDVKIGNMYGKWEVIGEPIRRGKLNKPYWLCRCACELHTEKYVSQESLKNGRTTSCGCRQKQIMKNIGMHKRTLFLKHGELYGRWKVIEYSGKSVNGTNNTYLCECSCPFHTQKIIPASHLTTGATKGCVRCKRFNNIVGQTFGYLTVKELDVEKTLSYPSHRRRTFWKVMCKCGKEVSVREDTLYQNHIVSCGCRSKEYVDLSGKRFGYLTVLSLKERRLIQTSSGNQTSKLYWNCLCDCGKETIVEGSNLKSSNTFSCGCMKRSHGEELIFKFLQKYQFNYKEQYRIDKCKDILSLPFDFALFDAQHNLVGLVEFDGEQHFSPHAFNISSEDIKMKDFEKTCYHDNIKNQYCYENKIPLLRITFEDLEDNEWIYILWDFLYEIGLIISTKKNAV